MADFYTIQDISAQGWLCFVRLTYDADRDDVLKHNRASTDYTAKVIQRGANRNGHSDGIVISPSPIVIKTQSPPPDPGRKWENEPNHQITPRRVSSCALVITLHRIPAHTTMDPTKAQTVATFAHLKKEKANKVGPAARYSRAMDRPLTVGLF